MKHVFLFCVLIFSLLAICNCKNDLSPGHVTQTEAGKEPVQKPEKPEVLIPEAVPPVIIPPEIITPETVPPEVLPPETIPPEEVTPEDGTQEGELEEGETETDEETPIIEITITEPQYTALLQINELRTEIPSVGKSAEFIEIKVVKGGSMEGLYLYSFFNNGQDSFIYIFPEIDVTAGEYITLHLRELESCSCWDELRDDLTISGGVDSCPTARDLWVSGNTKLLYKTDIVYIQDVNGKIMDAVIINEKPSASWNSNQARFAEIAERLFNAGMWQTDNGKIPTPLDAVNTSGIGNNSYKTVSRYEGRQNTHSAKDWFVSNALTPGLPNK